MFEVSLFGKFRICRGECVLNQDEIHSEMIIKLLSYIFFYRDRLVTVDELTDVLWSEDETGNPGGALKNLMYRLRNVLREYFGEGDYILNSRGAYCWNSQYELNVDCESFEKLCKNAEQLTNDVSKLRLYEEAVDLYKGDFLVRFSSMQWVIPLATYYHSMFLTAVKKLTGIYYANGQYENMERVSARALSIDTLDETLHCQLIRALIYQNKSELANDYYARAEKLLSSSLGICKSEQLKEVQSELINMQTLYDEAALQDVNEEIAESEEPEGAYVCSYTIFKEIYRLEYRRATRLGEDSEYILLLTISLKNSAKLDDNEQYNQYQIKRAMNVMHSVLKKSLRISDVASRYSNSQYVVLLPLMNHKDCQSVAKRIIQLAYEKIDKRKFEIKSDVSNITGNKLEKDGLDLIVNQ